MDLKARNLFVSSSSSSAGLPLVSCIAEPDTECVTHESSGTRLRTNTPETSVLTEVSAGHVGQVSTSCCLTAPRMSLRLGFIMCIKINFHLKFCFERFLKLHQKPQLAKEYDPLLQCWSKSVLCHFTLPEVTISDLVAVGNFVFPFSTASSLEEGSSAGCD